MEMADIYTPVPCQSCIDNNLQWQEATEKIAVLEDEVFKVATENRIMRDYIRRQENLSEAEIDSLLNDSKKCSLCEVKLTPVAFERHLCIEQESILCPLCPKTNEFRSTIAFLNHVNKHTEATLVTDKRFLFKCNQCTFGYPMEVLLKCHKKSHIHQSPEPVLMDVEPPHLVSDENEGIIIKEISDELSVDNPTTHPLLEQSTSIGTASNPVQGNNKMFKCGVCDMSFEVPKMLAGHIKEAHRMKKVTVSILPQSKSQSSKPVSAQSMPRRGGNAAKPKARKTYQCFLCRFSFSTFKRLKVHITGYHRRDRKCKTCRMELTAKELKSHLCGDRITIRCEYCSDIFITTPALMKHFENSHKSKKVYKCGKCPKNIETQNLKQRHQKSHELDAPKRFVCEICSEAFSLKSQLTIHSTSHNKEKFHLSEECGKSFSSLDYLKTHKMSAHDKNPKFQCSDCPKAFSLERNLRAHSEIHRNNIYFCEIRHAQLQSMHSYRKHKKNHERTEDNRKFACKLCPQKFFTARNLEKHQCAYTGVRLFNCQYCSKTFKYNCDLQKHLRTHLGD